MPRGIASLVSTMAEAVVKGLWSKGDGMLFDFEGREGSHLQKQREIAGGCSSDGRAPALHAGGQEFEPPHLHHMGA